MFSIFDEEPVPNKFTKEMGKKIRNAREDSGLSQADLAKDIFRRRATVSDIENGKSEVGTITLSRIAAVLNKPISYFFPEFVIREIEPGELSPLAKELYLYFDLLYDENLQNAVIDQVKALAEYSPTQSLIEILENAKNEVITNSKLEDYLKRHRKRIELFKKE